MDITKEIEQISENMEKSAKDSQIGYETIRDMVLEMGPEKLKAIIPTLTKSQAETLNDVLEDMKKSHDIKPKNPKRTAEAKINSTPNGDYIWNEEQKMVQDFQDEVIMNEIVSDGQQQHRNQGDNTPEGFDGQIIKAEGEDESEQKIPESMGDKSEGKKDSKDKEDAKKKIIEIEAEVEVKKSDVLPMIQRMQERELEKSICISKMAELLGKSEEQIGELWDTIEKAGKMLKEESQVEQPKDKSASNPDAGPDSSVQPYKDKSAKKDGKPDENDRGGDSKTTADEGEKPPMVKKSFDGLKPSNSPFTHRKHGQNAHYNVDEFLANEYVDSFQKSKFDWEDTENFNSVKENLEKSEDLEKGRGKDLKPRKRKGSGPSGLAMQTLHNHIGSLMQASSKESADTHRANIAAHAKKHGIPQEHIDAAMEQHKNERRRVNAEVRNEVKKSVNDYIAEGSDVDGITFEQLNKSIEKRGAYTVKTFNDSEMDKLFKSEDMWSEEDS